MPRPADASLMGTSGAGFGSTVNPADLGSIEVSPIHSLDVDGATEGAKLLAAVFSKPFAIASKDATDRYNAQQEADKNQGQIDAMNGNVDQEQMRSVMGMASAYANGVKMSQTQMKGYEADQKARQLFAANPGMSLLDTTDENGNKVPGLHTQIDNIFANAFPGDQEKDPTIANVLAPIMQHTLNEITAASYQHKIRTDQQTAEDSTQAGVMHAIQFSTPISIPMELDKLTKVYGSDARQGREALVHAIGEAAVATANPDAITKYLPPGIDLGGGATLTPENQQYLDAAKNRALEAQTRGNHVAAQSAANGIADSMLSGTDPTAQLHDYLKIPGASATEALDMFNWYYRRGKERASDSVDNDHNTWDMDRALASGDITSGSQLIGWLSQRGVGNTKAGNQLLQRGMSNLRSFQSANADDPDYRAGLSFISNVYKPGVNPLTGKFMNDAANSQQAGAMVDYRQLYQQQLRIQGTSATDAARKAQKAVLDKWGDPVESTTRKQTGALPKTYADEVDAVRQAGANPKAFLDANISGNDIAAMRDSGLISQEEAANAAQVRLSRLTTRRTP
jgi:hypothetical protein